MPMRTPTARLQASFSGDGAEAEQREQREERRGDRPSCEWRDWRWAGLDVTLLTG